MSVKKEFAILKVLHYIRKTYCAVCVCSEQITEIQPHKPQEEDVRFFCLSKQTATSLTIHR